MITSSRISFSVITILLAGSTLVVAQAAEVTFSESSRVLILRTEQGAGDVVEQLYVAKARPDSTKAHKSVDIEKYYGNNVFEIL